MKVSLLVPSEILNVWLLNIDFFYNYTDYLYVYTVCLITGKTDIGSEREKGKQLSYLNMFPQIWWWSFEIRNFLGESYNWNWCMCAWCMKTNLIVLICVQNLIMFS